WPPEPVVPSKAFELQCSRARPHLSGAVALTVIWACLRGATESWCSTSVRFWTLALRRSGVPGVGCGGVNPRGGVMFAEPSVVSWDEVLTTVTWNVVSWPAVVYAGEIITLKDGSPGVAAVVAAAAEPGLPNASIAP